MALSMSADPSRSSRTLLNAANPNLPSTTFCQDPPPAGAAAPAPAGGGAMGAVLPEPLDKPGNIAWMGGGKAGPKGGLPPLSKLWTAPTIRGPLPGMLVLLE